MDVSVPCFFVLNNCVPFLDLVFWNFNLNIFDTQETTDTVAKNFCLTVLLIWYYFSCIKNNWNLSVLSSGQGRVGEFRGPGGRGQGIRRNRGRGRGSGGPRGGGRGGGRGRGRDDKVSAEDLDAELEKYHAEAMQLNWRSYLSSVFFLLLHLWLLGAHCDGWPHMFMYLEPYVLGKGKNLSENCCLIWSLGFCCLKYSYSLGMYELWVIRSQLVMCMHSRLLSLTLLICLSTSGLMKWEVGTMLSSINAQKNLWLQNVGCCRFYSPLPCYD